MSLTRAHLFGFAGLVALAFALYWAKSEAQTVREQVIQLQGEVEAERRQVRTLEAELAFIERPDRLETAAIGQLNLEPIAADRIATIEQLDQLVPLPMNAETPEKVPVTSKPIAEASR
ncbi:cell division protein FtsL [Candidatus Phycosocius spiralis]|uniref:Cell division protein FtsL n=1 Tax=Candidatus Phycosocius spiralis TaxID=2815099 RepID=A0ABQ4PU60_9PROT|nr:hypothetical protein [Candidatus Phycosocius spiralis]GIU66258.1 hypothetical protein PsB1_0412 [Candidatus Phycosocius spiralis]